MDSILTLGIMLILFLQSLAGWPDLPMKFFSFLGTEEFYLFVAPALVWCVSPAIGLRTGLGLMVSGVVNCMFKLLFTGPRPYWIDERVLPMSSETTFGVPSGHAQNAMVVWGMLATQFRRRWVWILSGALIFLIGFSRLYLGMHFPHDVLLGWLIGAALLWALLRFEKPLLDWLQHFKPLEQIVVVFGVSLSLMLVSALARLALGEWSVPLEWSRLASRAPGAPPIDPLALSGMISNAGVFFGMAAGAILLQLSGWFEPRGTVNQLALRYALGILGVALIWNGLGAIFPRGESLLPFALRFIRYALIGVWITYLAPRLFIRLNLARPVHRKPLAPAMQTGN